jgi:hypothetical protein
VHGLFLIKAAQAEAMKMMLPKWGSLILLYDIDAFIYFTSKVLKLAKCPSAQKKIFIYNARVVGV